MYFFEFAQLFSDPLICYQEEVVCSSFFLSNINNYVSFKSAYQLYILKTIYNINGYFNIPEWNVKRFCFRSIIITITNKLVIGIIWSNVKSEMFIKH